MMVINYSPAIIISFAVIASGLGGLGESFQLNRIFLIMLIPLILMRLDYFCDKKFFNYENQIIYLSIFLVMIGFTTLFWSVDVVKTMGFLVVLSVNLLPLILVGLLSDDELLELRKIIPLAWAFSASLVLPLALYEIFTGQHFLLDEHNRGGGIAQGIPFAAGFFGNLNNLSLYIFFCFFGISFYDNKNEGRKILYFMIGISLLIFVVIFVNLGRGVIISAILLGLVIILTKVSQKIFYLLAVLSVMLMIMVCITTTEVYVVPEFLDYGFLKFTDFGHDLEASDGRMAIITAGLEGFLSSYGLGVGAGASTEYFTSLPISIIPNAHNLLLEWSLSFGFLGLILIVWFVSQTVIEARKNQYILHTRLILAFIFLMPIFGVVQSTLIGYTYFWLAITTMVVFSRKLTNNNFKI